jgi:HK97 family phage portal protein
MSIISKYVKRLALKALQDEGNQLFRQMFEWINTDQPIWIGEDQQDYIDKGYLYNDLVYSIIKTKADAAKSINWLAYKVVDEKALRQYRALSEKGHTLDRTIKLRTKALEEIDSGEIFKLIDQPNKHQSMGEIVEEYFSWMDLMGNFYLYGLPAAMGKGFQSIHVAPSHFVEIIAGSYLNPIKGYRMKSWFQDIIPAEQMLHIKNWNPDYDTSGRQLYGVSPLQAGGRILTLDNTGLDSSATTFKNQGVRGIIHRATGNDNMNFTLEQAAAIKEKVDSWSSSDKAGGLAATNAPIGYTKIGESPVDMGILQSMSSNLQRLCNLLQVPVELFAPGSTFNNKSEARKHMITMGVLPKMNILRNRLNRWWVEPIGKGYWIDYDMMSITELQDDLEKISRMVSTMTWLTDNEKRSATNYDDYEHPLADSLFVDPNRIPIDMAMFDTGFENIDNEINKLRK